MIRSGPIRVQPRAIAPLTIDIKPERGKMMQTQRALLWTALAGSLALAGCAI